MELDYELLKDKILGCWHGKNAGGVLGAPMEGHRGPFNVDWYLQKNMDKNPPANDDLDLQLVWLRACEQFGPAVTPTILGEYWMSYITPFWSEYGISKSNMRRGVRPPMSGWLNNYFKDSCGCFIRSEIWACLFPGNPEYATRYAYFDGCVDHADEGLYGELFFAALESAAFLISDLDTLVDIALSYIPEDCAVAKAVKLARDCYKAGKTWEEARRTMCREVPGAFSAADGYTVKELDEYAASDGGMSRVPIGFDAPNNIGFTMIGLYYGENDFGKTVCAAANCGEDTDCTAATAGAVFGIIHGAANMPAKWLDPVGGIINTVCINNNFTIDVPHTVDELTERILACIPRMNDYRAVRLGKDGYAIRFTDTALLHLKYCDAKHVKPAEPGSTDPKRLLADREPRPEGGWASNNSPFFLSHELAEVDKRAQLFMFDTFKLVVKPERDPYVSEGDTFSIKVSVLPSGLFPQYWISGHTYTSNDGVKIVSGRTFSAPLRDKVGDECVSEIKLEIERLDTPDVDILIDVAVQGRPCYGVAKIKLFAR